MRLISAAFLSVGLATPALAGVDEALSDHILPGYAEFAEATEDLMQAARNDCRAEALQPAFHSAFDAWMPVADIRLGPSETGALSIAFWPDTRGFTPRTLRRFMAEKDPIAGDVDGYAEVSIAARGLFALEMLIFDPEFADYARGSYACQLVASVAADLHGQAEDLSSDWDTTYADTLRTAGAADNATYLTQEEAVRAIYTQILSSLEFTANQRLGAPLGTFDRPRPARAEARRSDRSLRNVMLAAQAAHGLATALSERDLPAIDAALQAVNEAAARIGDAAFKDVTDPQARLHVEVLQQRVRSLHEAIQTEIGADLGIAPGFNAQDGD
ncbi:Imelysin (plasmid) [Roseivivax sp. THAF40]|uniref:imelysin family protein n=1 Tax=unclassified Roseivivax TaxID=2639302 RepID=UPI0012683517|nr:MULTISPECIES: imelysin family protein [unclassified Roseivivax]QFS84870.1 Imelysin [Roseivivax sp. THAF197b]QFT48772.1 Imelysin [Roseivivax sp. THAF40]